jgi:hypothetical protein
MLMRVSQRRTNDEYTVNSTELVEELLGKLGV